MGVVPSPREMLNYVIDNGYESDFLTAIQLHKENYSIGEIADKNFRVNDSKCRFISKSYNINLLIEDEDIILAAKNEQYISAFVSRKDDLYQVHFLVHKYLAKDKPDFEEEIAREVIDYMIIKTIIALRLDSEYKIDKYIKNN